MYPDQGAVQIGNEQVQLSDYMIGTTFGEDVGGEIYAGVTKIGGMWFGIKRFQPADVKQLVYRADAPSDATSWNKLGPAYVITIDVLEHVWEDVPAELK